MDSSVNIMTWFEIPVHDMARAKKFYEAIFSIELKEMEMMGTLVSYFPADETNGKVSGNLCKGPGYVPGAQGATIYLNGNPDLSVALGKVEAAGGKIVTAKTKISDEIGYMAFFSDTEGNKLGIQCGPDAK